MAERLFGKPVPNLFEWLVQQLPDLPQARCFSVASPQSCHRASNFTFFNKLLLNKHQCEGRVATD
ncbi:hypothetical protein [Pantanalinema sp. GBBB05]|uniref:hypothetical protein n=1 Tax=Pantanalinema sp. GBBB05 TaxID=2604139 RepID=UPI003D81B960